MSTPAEDPAKAASLRILRALDEAAAKLEAVERAHTAPIAVIGVGCRLPGGVRNAADFWRLLHSGIDATSEVPPDRWDVDELYDPDPEKPGKICSRRGGFLSGEVDRFDAAFFGISPREATTMDPQHRLLLEVAHEALDSANQLRDRFEENSTGVFIGLTNSDYSLLLKMAAGDRPLDHYFVTGTALNAAAGRISYLLGLRGPSVAIDSACSSSLVTVHLACQSLRSGECAMAVAGGVNLILTPDASAALSRTGLLAPDGRCKTFDASADGYTRSEGCAMVVLKRLDDAQRDGDPILALIRGSAVNQDGPSSGFTVPSGAAQRRLIKSALAAAKIAPADIDYVEAHGTGTLLGDPIEVGALGDVLSVGRPVDRPLLIGSVKTNLGHLESAAGVTGLIKVALSLWHREIPAHLHCRNPSSRIPWKDFPLQVVTTRQAWPERNRPLRAGVSSFGVSGTNAHVVLEAAPAAPAAKEIPVPKRQFYGERYWGPPRASDAIGRDWLYAVEWISAARPCDAAASALASGAALRQILKTHLAHKRGTLRPGSARTRGRSQMPLTAGCSTNSSASRRALRVRRRRSCRTFPAIVLRRTSAGCSRACGKSRRARMLRLILASRCNAWQQRCRRKSRPRSSAAVAPRWPTSCAARLTRWRCSFLSASRSPQPGSIAMRRRRRRPTRSCAKP